MLARLKHNICMNKLNISKRTQIISALVEGNSLRATARMCDVAFNTVLKLLPEIGRVCAEYQDKAFRNLTCKRIECDEIWSFCYAKAKNVTPEIAEKVPGAGDVWTWVAIDPDSKLVPSFWIGRRDLADAREFINDLASRLASRVQITTDGLRVYAEAIEGAFGCEVDYAMLVKIYGNESQPDTRYSPAECIGCQQANVIGWPDKRHISTSHVERQNLTMRMQMRRFTRLTNGFSKKLENHVAQVALHYMFYNFCRIHKSLRVTPAMAAGISDHMWSIEEIAGLLNADAAGEQA
jgi:IS1 family transposase